MQQVLTVEVTLTLHPNEWTHVIRVTAKFYFMLIKDNYFVLNHMTYAYE